MAALNLGDQLRHEKGLSRSRSTPMPRLATPGIPIRPQQKAGLHAGETYDLLHKREEALKKYQESHRDVNSSNARARTCGRERLKRPYRE